MPDRGFGACWVRSQLMGRPLRCAWRPPVCLCSAILQYPRLVRDRQRALLSFFMARPSAPGGASDQGAEQQQQDEEDLEEEEAMSDDEEEELGSSDDDGAFEMRRGGMKAGPAPAGLPQGTEDGVLPPWGEDSDDYMVRAPDGINDIYAV